MNTDKNLFRVYLSNGHKVVLLCYEWKIGISLYCSQDLEGVIVFKDNKM